MKMKPEITIVIPIYNVEKYLSECIESIITQSIKELEIICVDDCSTDASAEILKTYAESDGRIKIITFKENRTASVARKEGALASNGKYIWFVDGDDKIMPDACEKLLKIANERQVDILQFGTNIINEGNLSADRILGYKKFLQPHTKMLYDEDILRGCFEKNLYGFTIWNKLYSADLCKKAFGYVENIPLPIAQDKYAYFVLAYFAETYVGVTEEFYQYRLGAGTTAKNVIDRKQHTRHCKMAWVDSAIRRFSEKLGASEKLQSIMDESKKQLLRSCVGEWNYRALEKDKAWGYDEMIHYWNPADVIGEIARLNWYNKFNVAKSLKTAKAFEKKESEVKTIGVYYHHLSIGGAQRVVAQLTWLWTEMGYQCVLITDEETTEFDYEIPASVDRVVIPSYFELTQDNYINRATAWQRIIDGYGIDTVVYHSWMANCILWDILAIKSFKARTMVHCHGVFSLMLQSMPIYWGEMPEIYRLADGIITLSKADQYYWNSFNKRTYMVINPALFYPSKMPSASLEEKNVVWVGRVSDEKRPFEALDIFAEVVKTVTDAKFYMVGDSEKNRNYLKELQKHAKKLGIEKAVEFAGFQKDVAPYYLKSSVFMMTSTSEGFSLTLLEAKSFGLPCVMYELPYLVLTERNRGIVPVQMGDKRGAAKEIIDILENEAYRKDLAEASREHALELEQFDYKATWKNIFDSLNRPIEGREQEERQAMWNVLLEHYRIGAQRRAREVYLLNKALENKDTLEHISNIGNAPAITEAQTECLRLEAEIRLIRASWTYRIGRFVTFIPRKIRGGIRCFREHGWSYTKQRILIHLRLKKDPNK